MFAIDLAIAGGMFRPLNCGFGRSESTMRAITTPSLRA